MERAEEVGRTCGVAIRRQIEKEEERMAMARVRVRKTVVRVILEGLLEGLDGRWGCNGSERDDVGIKVWGFLELQGGVYGLESTSLRLRKGRTLIGCLGD